MRILNVGPNKRSVGGGGREKKENKKIEVTVVVGKVPIEQKMGVN